MNPNTTSIRALLRSLRRVPGCALALAALGLSSPSAQAGKYFDTDGATAGFQATDGATYTTSNLVWNTSSSGIGTLEIITPSGGTVIGNAASDFSGYHITLDIAPSPGNGVAGFNNAGFFINSNNLTFTLTNSYVGGIGNFYNMGSPWAIAAGSTVNVDATFNYNPGMNWGSATTFQGGGTINFNTMFGFNSNQTQTNAGAVINLKAAGATVSGYSGGFTQNSGTLNFAAAPAATAFQMFPSGKPFAINGGTVDNTSGSPMTLTVGAGGYRIGGNFTFPGSSDLNFGTAPVALTGTRQITATDKTLTIGGTISGSGFGLTKTGNGTLLLNGMNTYDGLTTVSSGTLGGSGTLAGAATFEAGSKAVFTVTPGGPIGNNSSVMQITGAMTFNANEVHLNLPANLPGGTYVLAYSDATPVANGAFPTPVVDSGSFAGTVSGATITVDTVTKQLILTAQTSFTGPVQLAITEVNGGTNPTAGAAFGAVVQAQNGSAVATPVLADTAVTLSLKTGTGTLAGTLSGTILAGQSQVTVSGATYTKAESGVVLQATRTSGDDLISGLSAAFAVDPAAASATQSTVTAIPGGVPADGTTPITVTVTVLDPFNNPIPGASVLLVSTRGATDTVSFPNPDVTGSNGVASFTVTSSTAGPATLSATVDSATLITQTAPVIFGTSNPNLVVGQKQFSASSLAPDPGPPAPIGVVSGDLLQTSVTSVTMADGFSQPESWMRNGLFTDDNQLYQKNSNNPLAVTYALNLATNPLGYDIKEIRMFSNPYPDRSGQSYDIYYSTIEAPDSFILLGSVATPAGEYGVLMTRTYDSTTATPDAGPAILTAVAKIRFNFRIVGSYGIIWREFDVTGTPTPVGTTVSTTTLARSSGTGTTSNPGEMLSFDVTVSGGSGTPTGTVTLKDGGSTGTTLGSGTLSGGACTITTTTLGGGTHDNIVAVYSGNLTYASSPSSALVPAHVVITSPPPNDNFADAIVLVGNTGTHTGTDNIDATLEAGEPALPYPNPETQKTVWFKWACTQSGTFTISTVGTKNVGGQDWDAVVHIYDGNTLATLNQLAFADADIAETVNQAVTAGTTYHIRLSWGGGPTGNAVAERDTPNILLNWSFAAGATYANWASTNAPGQTPNQDYDQDGVDNGIEYFMGQTGSSFTALPSLTAGNTVTWPMSATFSGNYEVETSSNLGAWTAVSPKPIRNGDGNLVYTLPPGAGRSFVRLVVTPN